MRNKENHRINLNFITMVECIKCYTHLLQENGQHFKEEECQHEGA